MYNKVEIIDRNQHKDATVKLPKDYSFAKHSMDAPIALGEFFEACKDYPILFIKSDVWGAIVLLGVKEKENLFITKKHEWEPLKYIPAFFRRYPFIFANPENQGIMLAVDGNALHKTGGEKLFDKDGNNTKFLDEVLTFANELHVGMQHTSAFVEELYNLGILEEKNAQITKPDGATFSIDGFYGISEEKMQQLSDEQKSDLFKKGAIPFITAHLISISNLQKISAK